MVPIWLAVILAVAGFAVWMWRKPDFNLIVNWKEAAITATVVACAWLCWWQVGIPFLNWEAGNFNIGVFGLAWLVPVILDSMIPKKKK
jgi:hypothetical protein